MSPLCPQVLLQYYPNLTKAVGSSEKIFEFLDQEEQVAPTEKPEPNIVQGHLQLEDVWFSYPEHQEPILKVGMGTERGTQGLDGGMRGRGHGDKVRRAWGHGMGTQGHGGEGMGTSRRWGGEGVGTWRGRGRWTRWGGHGDVVWRVWGQSGEGIGTGHGDQEVMGGSGDMAEGHSDTVGRAWGCG